jgi:pyridoxine 4-dehydrogenase
VRRAWDSHHRLLARGTRLSGKHIILSMQGQANTDQTGKYKKFDDLEPDSMLRHFPRFQPEVFDENLKLADSVAELAKRKGVTSAQIAIGWVLYQSGKPGMPTIIPIPGATTSERVKENSKPAKLSEADFKALQELVNKFPPTGGRYPAMMESSLTV